MRYALINTSNELIRTEDFESPPPALAIEKGLRWLPFREDIPDTQVGQVVYSTDIQVFENEVVAAGLVRDLTYVERRKSISPCYTSLEEQLDMQYKDSLDGGNRWISHISEVKAAHPKPVA